jgi:hypothetical protein
MHNIYHIKYNILELVMDIGLIISKEWASFMIKLSIRKIINPKL